METQELYRNPVRETAPGQERLILNEAQQKAVTQFCTQYDAGERKPWLLYGVTGSGKTLCYIEMIQHVTAQGKQAIVLIPEIALTFQTVQRFYRRFGSQVSVLHIKVNRRRVTMRGKRQSTLPKCAAQVWYSARRHRP